MKLAHLRRHLLHHPLIIVPPVAILLAFAWQQYLGANRNLNSPSSNANLLSVNYPSTSDSILGWKIAHSGNATYTSQQTQGIVSDKAIKVSIMSYGNGDITLTGPKITLESSRKYLFKGYYTSTTSFTLLAHYYYSDGTESLANLKTYPAQNDDWTTVGQAFTSTNITAVQFVYKLTNPGSLTIDGVYLEPKDEVIIPEGFTETRNLIPNNNLTTTTLNQPDEWISYQSGDNTASFSYLSDTKGAYLQADTKNFRNGEAKWQYTSQPVAPYNRYAFKVDYKSDTPVNIIAEYVLKDGKHQFETVAALPPAGQWTTIEKFVEAPSGTSALSVSLVLNSNGSVSSRNYSLEDITKAGDSRWTRPIVSFTFDDGWRSAYTQAVPILNIDGYKATFYITPSIIETPHFMSANDLASLFKDGHEIASHSYSRGDLTMMSQNALSSQLRQGQSYLTDAGLPTSHFAPPYGKTDAEVEWFTHQLFTTSRGLDAGINTKQNIDPYNLKVLSINKETSLDELKDALEKTKQMNGWLILVYHNINTEGNEIATSKADGAAITTKAFTEQIAQIRDSHLPVLPIGAAYKEESIQ